MWSWELVGGVWGIVNVLLMELCIFFLSGSGLFDTVGFDSDVGFGSALMALCMSCNGEDGVALGPKPCVWRVVVSYLFFGLGAFWDYIPVYLLYFHVCMEALLCV